MTITQDPLEDGRLARLEATVDYLVREVGDIKEDSRSIRNEIQDFRSELRADMKELRIEMKALRTENLGETRALRTDMLAETRVLRTDMLAETRALRTEMHKWFLWVLGIQIGVLAPSLIGLTVTLILKL